MPNPLESSVNCVMASSRLYAASERIFDGSYVKYTYASRLLRPTLPRSWYICDSPNRSESITSMVLARGMSIPFSIMVDATKTSASPFSKRSITPASISSGICPCATHTRAEGASAATDAAKRSMSATRLYTTNTCPPRPSSRSIASRHKASSYSVTNVCTGKRSAGGVSSTDISRMPVIDMCNVRGMGVAVITKVSAPAALFSSAPRWFTPNRCCSSVITSDALQKRTSSPISACVPITISAPCVRTANNVSSRSDLERLPVNSTARAPSGSRKRIAAR